MFNIIIQIYNPADHSSKLCKPASDSNSRLTSPFQKQYWKFFIEEPKPVYLFCYNQNYENKNYSTLSNSTQSRRHICGLKRTNENPKNILPFFL